MKRYLCLLLAALLITPGLDAQQQDSRSEIITGEVTIPIERYDDLIDRTRDPIDKPRPAPAGYALGQAQVRVNISEDGDKASANIMTELSVKILEDEWVSVPILPAGTAVSSVTLNGAEIELLTTSGGLAWGSKTPGSYKLSLNYDVDALRSERGYSLAIPVPEAASMRFQASIPGTGLDAALIPSANTKTQERGAVTQLEATIPSTSGLHLSWRVPSTEGFTINRANYSGRRIEDAIEWNGTLEVELQTNESLTLELLPTSVTLSDVTVDGEPALISTENDRFATIVKGRGTHRVGVTFQIPIQLSSGPPKVALSIPPIPVSRVSLELPGKKEVEIHPAAAVTHQESDGKTIAAANVPMTSSLTLSWKEAVPAEIEEQLRANAYIYHAVHAEEGVLYVRARVRYEISRGKSNLMELIVPPGIEINRIHSPNGVVSDWRLAGDSAGKRTLQVFLNQKVEKDFDLDIYYDRSLVGKDKDTIDIPLFSADEVQRQRGMVALLASKEFTLKPVEEVKVTRVGENQLPAFVRNEIKRTIAHTFKYVERDPKLIVQATAPEKKQGRFDAMVNTLISLSDVTLKGSASVEVNVKSGKISELQLKLPKGVSLLNLTAPSLRTYKVEEREDFEEVQIQFTQDMEGIFRVEAIYELIMEDNKQDATVPTLAVMNAEVEQGRIAVEALSNVEVGEAAAKHLSRLDPNELPQQLVLKTTNPILRAYKYARVDPPYQLVLKLTRHKELEVQSAAINKASYVTLYTADGIAVTAASFEVRNSREQFLKVRLPTESEVWSVTVDGKREKPARREGSEEEGVELLIKIINSTTGFPVQMVYRTPVDKAGSFGWLSASLPRPEMVVTKTEWDVFLPNELTFGDVESNMTLERGNIFVSKHDIQTQVDRIAMQQSAQQKAVPLVHPLRESVPTQGVHFRFTKLYANQSDEEPYFEIGYVSESGTKAGYIFMLIGILLVWGGIFWAVRDRTSRPRAIGTILGGLVLLMITIGYFHLSPGIVVLVSIVCAIGLLVQLKRDRKKDQSTE